jgi:4-alpha-glucanotransferase
VRLLVDSGAALMSATLDQLAERLGIAASYRDQEGQTQTVPAATKSALIAAFGIRSDDPRALDRALGADGDEWAPPVIVLREDEPLRVPLALPPEWHDAGLHWFLTCEDRRTASGEIPLAHLPFESGKWLLMLPDDLGRGYHALDIRVVGSPGETVVEMAVVVVPRRAYRTPEIERGARLWGIAVQLYGLRSSRNWGIGDFTDLRALMQWAGRVGAATIGTNPLHALFLDDPFHISPYSPSSRHFINPLYIDVEACEEFAASPEAQRLLEIPSFRDRLAQAREADLVDYAAVTALKRGAFEAMHRTLRMRPGPDGERRRDEFVQFRADQGESLERFALFQVLREHMGRNDVSMRDWRRWPEALRDPTSSEVKQFAQAHEESVEFFTYLQWEAQAQLAACVAAGREAGLPIGLYLDLAVGTDAAGADTWAAPHLVASGATIGAPPDMYNRKGQNWGLPPLNVPALRAHAYRPFAELLGANMRRAGALRIDHVLGLMRLFWIPEGCSPTEGAYVSYPFDDLVGIVALESHRNCCMVIGEDLGTLPDGFQERMRGAGLLSYCLLYFERDHQGRFKPPSGYPADALVSLSTHDLPTIWGFWSRRDIAEKEKVGAYPEPAMAAQARQMRNEEIEGLLEALQRERLLRPGHRRDVVPLQAVLHFIARTPSRLLMVGIEDLIGLEDQANLPGTVDEHPNWRRRLPLTLERIAADPRVTDAVRILGAERPVPR